MREMESMEGSISGMEGSLNDKVKTTAVKRILVGSCKDYMSQREEDYQLDHDEGEMPFERFMTLVTRYMTKKAFEGEMDMGKGIHRVDEGETEGDYWQDWEYVGQYGSIDAVGGYGKSKGKGGACYNCGKQGT